MHNADSTPPSTLGQRIDALLGPLEIEARQYREAIDLGREQVSQMQGKIGQAEEALAEIESKMARVLETLTREEPMLASAFSRQASASPPAEAASAAVHTEQAHTQTESSAGPPECKRETDPMLLDPPPADDRTAVDEIAGLLDADTDMGDDTPESATGSLADAAERAEQAAQRIDGSATPPHADG